MAFAVFPILDVAERCGLVIDKNCGKTEIQINCPFCGDNKKHMYLNTVKNKFFCFRCGKGGSSVSLYAQMNNLDFFMAMDALKKEDVFTTGPCTCNVNSKRESEKFIRPIADRHAVYNDMLQMLQLSPEHRNNLIKRGLSEETIEINGYRTMPKRYSKEYAYMIWYLSQKYDLTGIPGFYKKKNQWNLYTRNGFLIPIIDMDKHIQGFQIRLDDESKGKYRCLSSQYFPNGTKSPTCIHVAGWNGQKSVFITEGALKADVSSELLGGECVIGLLGVKMIKGLDKLLYSLNLTEAIEAFDMDKFTNENVAKDLAKLNSLVSKQAYVLNI